MFRFLCKTILRQGRPTSIRVSSIRCISSGSATPKQHPFAVSYLVNTCGFSLESALSASTQVKFKTPDNADAVINMLKHHGFSQSQISHIVKKFPQALCCKPERTILPRLEFLLSKGISNSEVAYIFSSCPLLLRASLKKRIVPTFEYVSSFLESSDKTITNASSMGYILYNGIEKSVRPYISIFQDKGVPDSHIALVLKNWSRAFRKYPNKFRNDVEAVIEMGLNPLKAQFVQAVVVIGMLTKPEWKRKVIIYGSWGWSKEEILAAFKKHPWCMKASEHKIMAVMELFVNKMGCESSFVAKHPILISLSFEKRLRPRAFIIQTLLSKNLITMKPGFATQFTMPEKAFLEKYVLCFEEAPQLLKLYTEQLNLSK